MLRSLGTLLTIFALASSFLAKADGTIFRATQGGATRIGFVSDGGAVYDAENRYVGYAATGGSLIDANNDFLGFLSTGGAILRGRGSQDVVAVVTTSGVVTDLSNDYSVRGWVSHQSGADPTMVDKGGAALLFLLGDM